MLRFGITNSTTPHRAHKIVPARAPARRPRAAEWRALRSAVLLAALASAVIARPGAARADDAHDLIGSIAVEGIAATPARAGEFTRITFTLDNLGPEAVTVTGLRLPGGEPSRVLGSLGGGRSTVLSGLRVESGDRQSADGGALWIEVGPLARDLVAGSVLEARIVLGRYDAPFPVHVTPARPGTAHQGAGASSHGRTTSRGTS